jgi:uncharacterized protein
VPEPDCAKPEFLCQDDEQVRIVLDTNILVSACWTSNGLEAQVVDQATKGLITPCVSPEIRAEYREVLSRPKLAARGRAVELLAALEKTELCVETSWTVNISIDDDDNRFLECATAADADYIITGNLRHYPEKWGNTRIVNARTFLSNIGAELSR